jgi:hypothetical protein
MFDLIKVKPFIGLVITLILGAGIGLILSFTVLSSDDGLSNSIGSVFLLATGSAETGSAGYTRSGIQAWEENLPLTLNEARNLRWKKEVSCVSGVGYYSRKNATKSAASESYSLIFDSKDKVIGIYFYSENEQDSPWEQMQATGPFPYPHWGLHIFFQDSTNACL